MLYIFLEGDFFDFFFSYILLFIIFKIIKYKIKQNMQISILFILFF